MRSMNRGIVAAGAVAAGLVWAGTGTAAAGPPDDRGGSSATSGAAFGSLPSPDGSFFVFLSVFDLPGGEAVAGIEVFGTYGPAEGDYFECFDSTLVNATLDGLDGAAARGSSDLVCGGPNLGADGTASVTVDVKWEAYGRIDRSTVVIPGEPCVSLNKQRAADVSGTVTVSISLPGVEDKTATLTEGFGDVRVLRSVCPRGRD